MEAEHDLTEKEYHMRTWHGLTNYKLCREIIYRVNGLSEFFDSIPNPKSSCTNSLKLILKLNFII